MFRLNCNIVVERQEGGSVRLRNVAEVVVSTSVETFTDTCRLTLPRIYSRGGKDERDITKIFRRGDRICVELGYDGVLETVFKGYLKGVSSGRPVVIDCENEAWELKQWKLSAVHYPRLNLRDFVGKYMGEYDTEVVDVDLGEVRINEYTSLAKVFDYFMDHYPFRFFFRDGVFYGVMTGSLMLRRDVVRVVKFRFGRNIISDNLVYTLAEDVRIQVVAKAILRGNKKIEWKEPADGAGCEVRTFLVPGATTVGELKVYAAERLKTFCVDRMSGDFTAFGLPFVRKGDIVHLFDDEKGLRAECNDKRFVVEGVEYMFGKGGYRQKIKLGARV